jgi:hypothetical protein
MKERKKKKRKRRMSSDQFDQQLRDLAARRRTHALLRESAKFHTFLVEAIARADPHAIRFVKKFLLQHWECAKCGCSEEFDLDGEKICGCDSCSQGCEPHHSRVQRGARRPAIWLEACDLFAVLGRVCKEEESFAVEYIRRHISEPMTLPFLRHTVALIQNALDSSPADLVHVEALCARVCDFLEA